MKVMKLFLYIILLASCFFSCSSNSQKILKANNKLSIVDFLEGSKNEIFAHLKRNNFFPSNSKIVFGIDYLDYKNEEICDELNGQIDLSVLFNLLNQESLFTTAYFIDNNNILFAQSSNHTLISNTFTLSDNELNQKIALKALENNYSAYIILKCQNKMIIGFNNKVVDVFLLKNEELYLKSSVQNIY